MFSGAYHGKYGFDEFSHKRAILVKWLGLSLEFAMMQLPSLTPDLRIVDGINQFKELLYVCCMLSLGVERLVVTASHISRCFPDQGRHFQGCVAQCFRYHRPRHNHERIFGQ